MATSTSANTVDYALMIADDRSIFFRDVLLKGIVSLFLNQNAQAPDPVGDVQHSPQAPLAPKYAYDGEDRDSSKGIVYRL